MEEIVGLLFTCLRILVVEILFRTVLYWMGWSVCKVVTLGKYPNSMKSVGSKNRDTLVSIVGVAVGIIIFMAFINWV